MKRFLKILHALILLWLGLSILCAALAFAIDKNNQYTFWSLLFGHSSRLAAGILLTLALLYVGASRLIDAIDD